MKRFVTLILLGLMRLILSFRYKVKVEGLDTLNEKTLNKPGGVLFLPNHPTIFVDPTLAVLAVWKKFAVRPLIVEYMFYLPVVNIVMRFLNALPIPNFVSASNSLKKKKANQVFDEVIKGLKNKENFLIYPAGKTKHQAREVINASGVHRVLESYPDTNVVLVRIKGLWGSSFSRALTGTTPFMFSTIFKGVGKAIKSLLFFLPKREVIIELVPAPQDFPWNAGRLELSHYLENWYNRPDGLSEQKGESPGETLKLVSYSLWKDDYPQILRQDLAKQKVNVDAIPLEVQNKVKLKLSEITQLDPVKILPEMHLGSDLGLDSLDNAELIAFLDDEFEVSSIPVSELTTVHSLMSIASEQVTVELKEEEPEIDLSKWFKNSREESLISPEGETIHARFLNVCDLKARQPACSDDKAGVLTYSQAKFRVILLAQYIEKLPGKYVGILLPSSVAAYLTILACQLAGKVPLMVNWTVGPRHLESVVQISQVQVVLSSWAFIDRLENVDLNGVEDKILMLEDIVMTKISLSDKIKAYFDSKKSCQKILKKFEGGKKTKEDEAVLLFTSGTESLPKGVPLSHRNILSNQLACLKAVNPLQNDIMLGILPPFHSFGFTLSGLLPLISGFRVAYFPDPTNGKGVAKAIEKWKATMLCGAPSFLKGVFKSAKPDQLKTLRLCFTGAEKPSPDFIKMVNEVSHCSLGEGYGITECSPVLSLNLSGNPKKGVGQTIDGVEICIVSLNEHVPLKSGEEGLILARGPSVFSGYLNKEAKSPFLIVEGQEWYSTGDLGYLDSEGNLILSGRLKRFVKIGGEMVSLAAIESALYSLLDQSEPNQQSDKGPAFALCAEEETGEKPKLFAFTYLDISVDALNRAIKDAGFSNLAKLSRVIPVEKIPLTGTGKIDYRDLENKLKSYQQTNLSKN